MSEVPSPAPQRRRGLGRGLDALLANSPQGDPSRETGLIDVDPAEIQANPEQPRRHFDEIDLRSLADSIRLHGLLHPIVVERFGSALRLVAGERRLRAARLGAIPSIPAILRPPAESARDALELALTENLLRSNLSPIEEGAAYARLADTFGLSHEAIALRLGRSRPTVSNTIRLLGLPPPVQDAVADGRISAGHARALLRLADPVDQEALAQRIEAQSLSVRDAERAVHARIGDPRTNPSESVVPAPPKTIDDEALRRGLEAVLGTPVRLERRRDGPRLVIVLGSDEDLHSLYNRLGGPAL